MKLRDIANVFIKYKVGNGNSMWVWFDNWHSMGPLYKRYGDRIIYDALAIGVQRRLSLFRVIGGLCLGPSLMI